jgi:hypothetical protein
MLQTFEINALTAALDAAGLDKPGAVVDAENVAAEALDVRDAIASEVEPAIVLELGKVAGSVENAAAWRLAHAERVTIARVASSDADVALGMAWLTAIRSELHEPFRDAFNAQAKRFGDALAVLDGKIDPVAATTSDESAKAYRDAVDSAARMSALSQARDIYADHGERGQCRSIPEERLTRILVMPSVDTVSRGIPIRTDGTPRNSAEWFAAVLSIPGGVSLKWNTAADQTAISKAMGRHRD